MYQALLQHAKEHEMTVKDFNWHKSNSGIATATTMDEIKTFKFRKGNGHRVKGGPSKTCSKCNTSYPPRECPAWGKKCHKCGNKNHFSTYCRSKQKGPWDSKRPHCGRITMRHPKGRDRQSKLRSSRSRSNTWSAHSIELNQIHSFQDHQEVLNSSKRHFTLLTGPNRCPASVMKWIQMAKPRSSQFWMSNYHTEMAWTTCESKLTMVQRLTSYL